ncbi:hypothetical protein [Paenibacillus caui]|uniref:hypothetical protein n=1 Tax=Paenibacillus caui TaxID=2873927 RepID=UPI001CA7D99A|nr:hypothetical protein [Paenibacillus caui]
MENTVCPWCQTEIVWDEEIGPEEECPHCHNELKGYRTLNIALGEDEEDLDHDPSYEGDTTDDSWEQDRQHGLTRLPSIPGEEHDLLAYESSTGKVLENQEQMPECPHCREYMLFTGQSVLPGDAYTANITRPLKSPLLQAPFTMSVYVCPACFHVSSFLTEKDQLRFVKNVQTAIE